MKMRDLLLLSQMLPRRVFNVIWRYHAARSILIMPKEGQPMLTKILRFDPDVVAEIRKMTWNEDFTVGNMPKMDRELYERVAKALTALGGKWVRNKGHVFPTDPRGQIEGFLEGGTITVARDGFFRTPAQVVERMLELVPLRDGWILEPEAGDGALLDALRAHRPKLKAIAVEINPERFGILKVKGYDAYCDDFLIWKPTMHPGVKILQVYMNPPFEQEQDIDHVRRAWDWLEPGGSLVSVMSEGAFFHETRHALEFRTWLACQFGRSIKLPPDSFDESGAHVKTRLVWMLKPIPKPLP